MLHKRRMGLPNSGSSLFPRGNRARRGYLVPLVVSVRPVFGLLFAILAFGASEASAKSFLVQFLVGGCLIPQANFDATTSYAKIAGWSDAPEEALPLLMPPEKPKRFAAWVVDEEGGPFVVAASVGLMDGAEIQSCAVMGQGIYAEVESAIRQLGGRLLEESDEVVQVASVFEVERLGNRMLVTVIRGPAEEAGLISAAVVDPPDR